MITFGDIYVCVCLWLITKSYGLIGTWRTSYGLIGTWRTTQENSATTVHMALS
jgi:hypothetical protein